MLDKKLFWRLRGEELTLSKKITDIYGFESRSRCLGMFTKSFYGKNQKEIVNEMSVAGIKVPEKKIVNIMDEVHLLYRILGYYAIEDTLKDPYIAGDMLTCFEKLNVYGIQCSENFKKLMKNSPYKWCLPMTDLYKVADGKRQTTKELLIGAIESTDSIRTKVFGVKPIDLIISNIPDTNTTLEKKPIITSPYMEPVAVEQLKLF